MMLLYWVLLAASPLLGSIFGEPITEKSYHTVIEEEHSHHEDEHSHHGNDTNGHDTNGHDTYGHDTNGHDTNGHDTNGHDTYGHGTNGHDINGHDTHGHDTHGHDTDGSGGSSDNCICFDKDNEAQTVPEVIDNYGYGVERIIIYIYRDRVTDSAVIHIPDKDRQKKFPDLEILDDDNLRYSPVNKLEYLFDGDSNAVIVNSNKNKHKDHASKSKHRLPKKIDRQDDTDNLYVKPISKYEKYQKKHYPHIPMHKKYEYNRNLYRPFKTNPATTVLWSNPKVQTDKYYNDFKYDDNDENKTSSNEDNSEQDHDELIISTLVPNQTSNLNILKYNPSTQTKGDNTLNTWIRSEINTLNTFKGNPKATNVDPAALKKKVLRILKRHGIRENPDGGLTDSNGLLIDMSNLRLRNVYVGDVLDYNRLVNRVSDAVELPPDSNLIKLLMISLLYPPKVLGMIPLGKVTGSIDKHGKRKFKHLKKTGMHDGNYIHYVRAPENLNFNYIRNPKMQNEFNKRKRRGGSLFDFPLQFIKGIDGQFIPNLDFENFRRSGYDDGDSVNRNGDTSNYRRNNDIVTPSFYKYSKSKNRDRSKDIGYPWETIPGDDYYDDFVTKKDPRHSLHAAHGLSPKQIKKLLHNKYNDVSGFSESEQPFGDPDFRIIGGAPATFSGMPISNRGRSGYIKP